MSRPPQFYEHYIQLKFLKQDIEKRGQEIQHAQTIQKRLKRSYKHTAKKTEGATEEVIYSYQSTKFPIRLQFFCIEHARDLTWSKLCFEDWVLLIWNWSEHYT